MYSRSAGHARSSCGPQAAEDGSSGIAIAAFAKASLITILHTKRAARSLSNKRSRAD